jgi:hypothetical protein
LDRHQVRQLLELLLRQQLLLYQDFLLVEALQRQQRMGLLVLQQLLLQGVSPLETLRRPLPLVLHLFLLLIRHQQQHISRSRSNSNSRSRSNSNSNNSKLPWRYRHLIPSLGT